MGESDDGVHEPRPKLHWTHISTTLSWADADLVMRDLSCKQCNGYNLRERSDFRTKTGLCFRFQCGFYNFLKCGWQVCVLVPFNQKAEIMHYYDCHPEVPAPAVIDAIEHSPQTMSLASVKSGMRSVTHKSHLCIIEATGAHVQHNGFQSKQAHCMFKAYCDLHPFALHYGRTDIMNWLKHENIDTILVEVDDETGETRSVDRLRQMVTVCKRYTTAKLKKLDKDIDIDGNFSSPSGPSANMPVRNTDIRKKIL